MCYSLWCNAHPTMLPAFGRQHRRLIQPAFRNFHPLIIPKIHPSVYHLPYLIFKFLHDHLNFNTSVLKHVHYFQNTYRQIFFLKSISVSSIHPFKFPSIIQSKFLTLFHISVQTPTHLQVTSKHILCYNHRPPTHPFFLKNIELHVEVSLSLDISIHSPDPTQVTQVGQPDISASNIDLAFSVNGFVIQDFNNVQAHISKLFH